MFDFQIWVKQWRRIIWPPHSARFGVTEPTIALRLRPKIGASANWCQNMLRSLRDNKLSSWFRFNWRFVGNDLPWQEVRSWLYPPAYFRRGMLDTPNPNRVRRNCAVAGTWWTIWPSSDGHPDRPQVWRISAILRSIRRWPEESSGSCCEPWARWIWRIHLDRCLAICRRVWA